MNISEPLKNKQIRCPNCSNFMKATVNPNGALTGNCNACHCIIYSKQHNPRERLIRIVSK